jgi:hypothetical protein
MEYIIEFWTWFWHKDSVAWTWIIPVCSGGGMYAIWTVTLDVLKTKIIDKHETAYYIAGWTSIPPMIYGVFLSDEKGFSITAMIFAGLLVSRAIITFYYRKSRHLQLY